jgi:DNA segregation ATPase FtsK/SpoIIIE, S-DNA-T family
VAVAASLQASASRVRALPWALIGFLMIALLVAIPLLTHSLGDPAWSTTGERAVPKNWLGAPGAWMADILFTWFGRAAWLVPLGVASLLVGVFARLRAPDLPLISVVTRVIGLILALVAFSVLVALRLYKGGVGLPAGAGGVLGSSLAALGVKLAGFTIATLAALVVALFSFAWMCGFSWLRVAEWVGSFFDRFLGKQRERVREAQELKEDEAIGREFAQEREVFVARERERVAEHEPIRIDEPVFEIEPAPKAVKRMAREKQTALFSEFASPLPPLELLNTPQVQEASINKETLEYTSRLIERKLAEFNVPVKVIAAQPGPVITRYEIEPDTGVKGSSIVNLARDLARSMSVVAVRVVETIPGKSCMGLEVPNPKRQMVSLLEILSSGAYTNDASPLSLAMGKDISGKPVTADLAKMPHCLVAGTTGSGKSVAINAMILSLLYKAEPSKVRLVLIDPKMLELSVYEGIPHLLCPVVTDMRLAANALNWCVGEMEKRYKLMSAMGVRNLAGFNTKVADAKAKGTQLTNPFSLTPDTPEPLQHLPLIVVVIDEWADLLMVVGKKIEELVARLAQKARAAGIHLIVATQRPSVDVITGLIKANIPSRVAFQVSSKVDSRTILDQMGAEALLGQGDMLYMPPGTGYPVRLHGAFVSDDEVHRVVEHLKMTGEPQYVEGILEGPETDIDAGDFGVKGEGGSESDQLYDQAVELVIKTRRPSISLVQRHLRIGYNRAARLIEQMEVAGLVTPMGSNGNRDVIQPAKQE